MRLSRTVKWFIVTCVCLIGIAGGFIVGMVATAKMGLIPIYSSSLAASAERTFRLMQKEALDPPDVETATEGVIDGILKSNGDIYARYLPEESFEKYTESMSGTFGGIGVVMEEKDGNVQVVQVYEDSPAEAAGVQPGDWFYAVGDDQRDEWTSTELQLLVRGEPGTDVTITFARPYQEGDTINMRHPLGVPYTVTIERDTIQVPITRYEIIDGNVGYIRLFSFNRNANDEIRADIEKLRAQGAEKFVFDLRSNVGGDFRQALLVASIFVDEGIIVKVESRVDGETIYKASGDAIEPDVPLVLLVDENSASAAEIVAAAVKDHGRGKLVGMNTFGKGSVQSQIPFGTGAVFLTTAHYLGPNGEVINNVGVEPDYIIGMPLDRQFNPSRGENFNEDIQLQEALRVLREQ
ncbi:MAG: S41 family peptidase [Coriobacteriia bacterium]|nr:S41 family peptidase [Coriobacteriia bacterium]